MAKNRNIRDYLRSDSSGSVEVQENEETSFTVIQKFFSSATDNVHGVQKTGLRCSILIDKGGEKDECRVFLPKPSFFYMKRHLERNHRNSTELKSVDKAIEQETKKENEKRQKQKRSASLPEPSESSASKQQKIDMMFPRLAVKMTREKFQLGILRMIAYDGHSLRTFKETGFLTLNGEMAENLKVSLSHDAIRQLVFDRFKQEKKNLSAIVSKKLIYLKMDAATRLTHNFLGINVQYYEDGKIEVKTLAVLDTKGQHSSAAIKTMVQNTMNEFSIDQDNVLSVSVDNAANMTRAIDLLNETQSADDEISETTGDDDDESSSREEERILSESHRRIANLGEDGEEDVDSMIPVDDWNPEPHDVLPPWLLENGSISKMRCVIHTHQLAIRDGLKRPATHTFLARVRKLVKKMRTTTVIESIRKQYKVIPLLDNETRWSSTFRMMERLLGFRSYCSSAATFDADFNLSTLDWIDIEQCVQVLREPHNVTCRLQAVQMTPGKFMYEWQRLKSILLKKGGFMSLDIRDSMVQRESKLFENDIFLAGVYVDTRNRVLLEQEQIDKAKEGLLELSRRAYKHQQVLKNQECVEVEPPIPAERRPSTSSSDELDEFEKELNQIAKGRHISQLTRAATSSVSDFHKDFIESCQTLEHLGRVTGFEDMFEVINTRFPESIQECSRLATCLPVSQASVERLFSALKFIYSDLRARMKPELLEAILFLRVNKCLDD